MYKRTPVGMDNLVTGESFNIVERPLAEDPMQMAARMVQDDLAIMFEKEDGQYYLLAGAILLAGFWRLEDKLGMPLSEIHTSGDVPGFKEKLEKGMMNFFRRVQPNGPVQRVSLLIPNLVFYSMLSRLLAYSDQHRTTTSFKWTTNWRGHHPLALKMEKKGQLAGSPLRRTKQSSTTISDQSARPYAACREVEELCLRSGRTSILLLRFAKSHTCLVGWRVP